MQVTTESLENQTQTLLVVIEPEKVASTFAKTYRQMSKYVNVPGFRPGKAPVGLVKQQLKPEYVLEEVRNALLRDTVYAALHDADVTPHMFDPDITDVEIAEGQPMSYKLHVPLEPTVELKQYKGLELTRYTATVTDEMVANETQARREALTNYGRVETPAALGDMMFVSETPHLEGEPNPRGARRHLVTLKETSREHPVEQHLFGATAGSDIEFDTEFPADYTDDELRGAKAHVTVHVHSVSTPRPPTDEELCAHFKVADMDALTELVRSTLTERFNQMAEEATTAEMNNRLLEANPVVVSHVAITSMARSEVEQLTERLRRSNYTLEQYIQSQGMTPDQWFQRMLETTAERMMLNELFRKIIETEGITAADDDVLARLKEIAATEENPEEALASMQKNQRLMDTVANEVKYRAVIDLIKSTAVYTEKDYMQAAEEARAARAAALAAQASADTDASAEAAPETSQD